MNMDLADVLDPLVDGISSLVLTAVSKQWDDTRSACSSVAVNAGQVVERGTKVSLASKDLYFQEDMADALDAIATSVTSLVESFLRLSKNGEDMELKRVFGESAQQVGDAINDILMAYEESMAAKLLAVVDAAEKAAAATEKASLDARLDTLNQRVREVAEATAVPGKKSLLLRESTVLDDISPKVADGGDAVVDLDECFVRVRRVAAMMPGFSRRFKDAFDHVKRFLALANTLDEALDNLVDRIAAGDMTDAEFVAAVRRIVDLAHALAREADIACDMEIDTARREQLRAGITDLRAATKSFVAAAKQAYQDGGKNETSMAAMREKRQNLSDAMRKLHVLMSLDDVLKKLFHSCKFLEQLIDELYAALPNEVDSLTERGTSVTLMVDRVCKDARLVALEQPSIADALASSTDLMKTAATSFSSSTSTLFTLSPPRDLTTNGGIVGKKRQEVVHAIHEVLVSCGLAERKPKPAAPSIDDNDMVKTAMAQVDLARTLASTARRYLDNETDPERRAQVERAISKLEDAADSVGAAAMNVLHDPNSVVKIRALEEAQRGLAQEVDNVIEATCGRDAIGDPLEALRRLANQDEWVVFDTCDDMLDDLNSMLESMDSLSPAERVEMAKVLATKAGKVAQQMQLVADRSSDPREKEALKGMASVLKDRVVQLKILAAVGVATEGGQQQVESSLRGVKGHLAESINALKVSSVKRKAKRDRQQQKNLTDIVTIYQQLRPSAARR